MSACITNHLLAGAAQKLEAAGVESPRLEARLLLAQALGVSSVELLRGLGREPTDAEIRRFEGLLGERARRVPLAYLRGTQEFYGLTFEVTPATLIPRPETELLVEYVLEKALGVRSSGVGKESQCLTPNAPEGERAQRSVRTLIDVGTGSGCIAVAVAVHAPAMRVVAVDISAEALAVARRNAARHHVAGRVQFIRGELLDSVASQCAEIIVSNPPYIPTKEIETLQPEVRDYEPRIALDGGPDGLRLYRRLFAGARRTLRPGGWLAVEVGFGQAEAVAERMALVGFEEIERRRDLVGIERVVAGRRGR